MNIKLFAFIGLMFISTVVNASQYNQPQTEVAVRWTTQADAGVFIDPEPTNRFIEYNKQMCVKEQSIGTLNGQHHNIIKVRCRQPDGKFAYIW